MIKKIILWIGISFIISVILGARQRALAEIKIPAILLLSENIVKTNCSEIDCPEFALILDSKFKQKFLSKEINDAVLPYRASINLSKEKNSFQLFLP